MRIRSKYWLVPALALVGILFALYFLWRTPEPPTDLSLPAPSATATATASETKTQDEPRPAALASASLVPVPARVPANEATPTEAEIKKINMEMKITLAGLYGAERSFFSEYHRYSTDLKAIGYEPAPGSVIHAKVGFLQAYTPEHPEKSERPDFMSIEDFAHDPHFQTEFHLAPEAENARLEDASRYCHNGCTASATGFEIAIVSKIGNDLNVWIVNENKVMTHETGFAPHK